MSALRISSRPTLRKVMLGVVMGFATICGFDLMETFLSSLVWPVLLFSVLAALPVLVTALVAIWLSQKRSGSRHVATARRWSIALGLLLLAPVMVALLHGVTLMPVKFLYLRHRVESAATAEAERRAFRLASTWGHVWEVEYVDRQHVPTRYRTSQAERLLKIEWLESWPSGIPFRAYRQVIDQGSLREFERKRSANKSLERTRAGHCARPIRMPWAARAAQFCR